MTVQLYVEFNLFVLPSNVNVGVVTFKSVVDVPVVLVQLYEVGVVTTPLTLNTTPRVAVLLSQLILLGTIVTTASGPVAPVCPVSPLSPLSPFSPLSPTYLDQIYEFAVVGAVALSPTYTPI